MPFLPLENTAVAQIFTYATKIKHCSKILHETNPYRNRDLRGNEEKVTSDKSILENTQR